MVMEKKYTPCFLHVDLDAFFASVEQLDNPEYRGKPVIVGGLPGEPRSVVSTASYEARKFGVRSAMPIATAYRLCPNGIYLHGRMKRYLEMSSVIMDIFKDFSPEVEQMSIDEAFIDLTGTEMLFGSPDETAKKIQKTVKEKTGLTVSIGLASTKYIAKIASGLHKPNGFTEIIHGDEEKFILSLPLEKIWGIGDKTRQRINSAGLKTTKDIHEKSNELLCTLFGNSTGNFLYKTVHGLDNGTFTGEAKSHSISAEHTFSHDITDIYAAETALLELSQTVMFRLLREQLMGKTVIIKLRYDDFSTTTAQNSSGNIISSDDLFDRARKLFEAHYESGRGIRLLGVAIGNVEDEKYLQRELFDDTPQKKQAVEKAIIDLEKKHPKIKVSRARLLKSLALFFVLFTFFVRGGSSQAAAQEDELNENISIPSTLFQYDASDNDISLNASGFWQAGFTQTSTATFGNGTPFAVSFGMPVFQQKVDLLLSFWLNNKFFFEAAFADEFTKNTLAMGYKGNGTVKNVRIANRGITFPAGYSIDLFGRNIGGGDNQAPGVSTHLENDRWKADIALRYDMTGQREATFYGMSSRTNRTLPLHAYERGKEFILPVQSTISDITNIYIESTNGDYTDSSGKKYKLLARDEYLLMPTRYQILISKNTNTTNINGKLPQILVTFSGGAAVAVESALGSYGKNGAASGYLGEIQNYFFGTGAGARNAADYSFAETAGDFFTTINGERALVIQSPYGFSPFAVSSRYDLGIGNGAVDAFVVSEATGAAAQNFEMVPASNDSVFSATDFFNETHIYADAVSKDAQNNSYNSLYRMFPFAKNAPGVYLGYGAENDDVIRINTSTPVTRYEIGTDADAGSVRVYINNVIDAEAKYDAATGTVTLSRAVSDTDKIYITWNEDTNTTDAGAIAGALGFSYNFTKDLTADTSFSAYWPVAPNRKFADSSVASRGFVSLAVGATYKNDTWENVADIGNFSVTEAIAVSLESENTIGTYRLLGMDSNTPSTYYLAQRDGYNVPSSITPSINPRPSETTAAKSLSQSANRSSTTANGISASGISGYAVPLEWSGLSFPDDWASVQIKLSNGELLTQGTEFSIALRPVQVLGNDVDVYLQLGIDAENTSNGETSGKISTWKIYDGGGTATPKDVIHALDGNNTSSWQRVKVAITDSDRAHLSAAHDARIIIVKKAVAGTPTPASGTILVGPYETAVKPVFVSHDSNFTVTTPQFRDNSIPKKDFFNSDNNYAQSVVWHNDSTSFTATKDNTIISAARYFKETDFSAYEKINLFFSYVADTATITAPTPAEENDDALVLIFDSDAENTTSDGRQTVRATVRKSELVKYVKAASPFNRIPELTQQRWHTLSVNLRNGEVSIDGNTLQTRATVNTAIVPSRMKMQISTSPSGTANFFKDGMFSFDEIHLEGASPSVSFQNITKASYKKDGTIVSAGGVDILENFSASAAATETVSTKNTSEATSTDITANAAASVDVLGVNVAADGAFASNAPEIVTNAGHSITSNHELLAFAENYRYNKIDNSLEKQNSASLSLKQFKMPLALSAETKSTESNYNMRQSSSANMRLSFDEKIWNTTFILSSGISQQILPRTKVNTSDYFDGWIESTQLAFSGGRNDATARKVNTEAAANISIPVAALKPEVKFAMDGNYSNAQNASFSDATTLKFSIPFAIKEQRFSADWQKTGSSSKGISAGGDYMTDYYAVASAMKNKNWYFEAMPIYDLVGDDISQKIFSETEKIPENFIFGEIDSLSYSSIYTLTWRRNISATLTDLFVPSATIFSVARDIYTARSISDMYNIKMTVQQTAFNIFGSQSVISLFKWYEQDEIFSSATIGVKIPATAPEKNIATVSGNIQANMYMSKDGIIQSGAEANADTDGNYGGKFSIAWKRQGTLNPIASFAALVAKNYDKRQSSVTITDSLEIGMAKTPTSLAQSYTVSHNAETKILPFFYVNYGLSATCMIPDDAATSISTAINLGGKATF